MFHAIHNFCVVDMSNFYLDIIKDRLYTSRADSKERRSAQTAMYEILEALVKMLAPVLAFTSEEVWQFMPHRSTNDPESVQLNYWPEPNEKYENAALKEKWDRIIEIRDVVSKALEIARTEKIIGHSLNAKVTIFADKENYDFIEPIKKDLVTVFIVSDFELKGYDEASDGKYYEDPDVKGIRVNISMASGSKCERCWMISESVGKNEKHPTLCDRCAEVVG